MFPQFLRVPTKELINEVGISLEYQSTVLILFAFAIITSTAQKGLCL